MNNLIHTLFLQHNDDHRRYEHIKGVDVDWTIKMAVGDGCEAAVLGRSIMVIQQLSHGQVSNVNDFYKAACILCATGSTTDLAMAHMCVLQIKDLEKRGQALSSEYASNFDALGRDTWNWYIASMKSGASE